jgi:hypothetical protein
MVELGDQKMSEALGLLSELHEAQAYGAVLDQAKSMIEAGNRHPVVIALFAEAALLQGDPSVGMAHALIQEIITHDPARAQTIRELVRGILLPQAAQRFAVQDDRGVEAYLTLGRWLLPEIAAAFDPSENPQPSGRSFRTSRADQIIDLGNWDDPSSTPRRVLFLMRKFYIGPQGREHDIGPRTVAGFASGGWPCLSIDPTYDGREWVGADAEKLLGLAQDYQPDLILIDFCGLAMGGDPWPAFFNACRHALPGTRIALAHFDAWQQETWPGMLALAPYVDLVWGPFPGLAIWDHPNLRDKVTFAPFMTGVRLDEPARLRHNQTVFQGGVEGYNASRAFWLKRARDENLPITIMHTNHSDDGRPPLESYRRYFETFLSVERILNFSMRQDGTKIVTGRTWEAVFAGACLIQESSPNIDYYLQAGQHYLSFSNFDELRDIVMTLDHDPDIGRAIARAGQEFFLQRFDDPHLVRHFEQRLQFS